MASLRSLIMAGRLSRIDVLNAEGVRSRDVILVNATATLLSHDSQLPGPGAYDVVDVLNRIPCPKPPFRKMWLEANVNGKHVGVFVERVDAQNGEIPFGMFTRPVLPVWIADFRRVKCASLVRGQHWFDTAGEACSLGDFLYSLDAEGSVNHFGMTGRALPGRPVSDDQKLTNARFLKHYAFWVAFTMGQFNCRNVKLLPMKTGGPKIKTEGKRPPYSVWHEIVVTPSRALERACAEDPEEAEKHAVRFHRVRGHFADYTKGKGLFGKWRVRIWVEEHEVGDPDLGTVKSSYRVE